MKKNAIVMIGLGVIAVLGVVYLMLDPDAPPGGPLRRPAAVPEIEADVPESPAHARVVESRQIGAIRPKRADPDSPDPEVDAMSPVVAKSPEESLRVLVVDESTGVPVPEAEVAWADESITRPFRFGTYAAASTLISDFDHATQRTVADARGVALVRPCQGLAIAARSGDRFGHRKFEDAPRGEVRLQIASGQHVAAKVVTDAGVPVAGVTVLISIELRSGRSSTSRNFHAATRDPDGLAIVNHTGVVFRDSYGEWREIGEVTASIAGAGAEGTREATVEDLRAGPIMLIRRPTGRVLVKLLDPDGRPFSAEARVSLRASVPPARTFFAAFEANATRGSAEFPTVAVGSVLTASAESAGYDTVMREKLEGPQNGGEDATIELRFVRQRAVVHGTAVDELSTPLSRRELQAELVISERSLILPGVMLLATGVRGEFNFTVDRGMPGLTNVDLLLEMRNGGGDAVERHARTPLPRLSPDSDTWLGEVRLSKPDVLASGVVHDEVGDPIAGAVVTADHMRSGLPPRFEPSIGPRSLPSGPRLHRGRTDESGAFVLRRYGLGPARMGAFGLKADLTGYVCLDPPTGLKPGAKDVMILLSATGVVEGRLLLPDLAPIRRLSLSVPMTDPASGKTANHRFEDCVDSSGMFRLTGVRPGHGKVEVRLRGVDEPIASIPDVAVSRLEVTDDSRLSGIDLRGHPALRAR
jgi:hypothetical protein